MKRLSMALLMLATCFPLLGSEQGSEVRVLNAGKRVVDAGFFGMHFHRIMLSPGEKAITTVWPPLQFGLIRLWDSRTRWAELEPARGEWRFARMDFYVGQARQRGAEVIYTLGSPPQWASARPNELCGYGLGCAAEPASMEDWRNYVSTVARRYRGEICCYEVWNEPNFSGPPTDPAKNAGFYSGSVAAMVEMARIAREVLKEEDPQATLLSPAVVNGPFDRLDKFLANGGAAYVQGVSYHFYADENELRLLDHIATVKAVMRKNGLAGLPLLNTETGIDFVLPSVQPQAWQLKPRTLEAAAALMVRHLVLNAYAGVQSYVYYAWDHDHYGMVDRAGEYRPSRDAMVLAQRWLLGAELDRCEIRPRQATQCWGRKGGKPFAIVWNPYGTGELDAAVPAGLRVASRQVAVPGWVAAIPAAPDNGRLVGTANPALYTFTTEGAAE
jgi:hypothetical protein